MNKVSRAFTIIELVIIIVIIGILAALAIPRFISFREMAINARAEGNIAALNSAIAIYYSKTALAENEYLCRAEGNPHNNYRNVTVSAPCYPASYEELESLLTSPPDWGSGTGGACYNSATGDVSSCQ